WADDNKVSVNIDYSYSDTVAKGKVISQSAVSDVELRADEHIDVMISNGKSDGKSTDPDAVTVPDSYIGYTEANFIKAIENLGLKAAKQTKTYENAKFADGTVYAYDSSSDGITFKKGDTVRYYLVKNSGQSSSDEKVTVPDTYLGYKETDFIAAIEKLGLKASKQSKTYTSKKYATGTVYIYDSTSDGITFKKGDTVKYYLVDNGDGSAEVVVPDTYLGYKEADFIAAIEKLGLKASKQSKTYTSQNYADGTVYAYDSTSDGITFKKGDIVKYYLVKNSGSSGSSETVIVPDTYLGYKEADFIAAIEKLGLKASKQSKTYTSKKYATGTVYIYDSTSDGITFKKGDTVRYYLVDNKDGAGSSAGSGSTNVTLIDLSGKTLEEAKTWLSNNGLNVTVNEESSSSVQSGKVISMSPSAGTSVKSGSTVTLNVSKGSSSASLLAPNFLISNYSRSTYQDTVDQLTAYFNGQGFTNVTMQGVASTKTIGQIVSVSVNGNSTYTAGDYPLDSKIVVQIVSERVN
ncbi:MAG: PASTA domain-containing protein, partial [Erysipelotrichaceae bacterium]|nr:PASTA domain-containing protein [Erysipelotrichaceae bacterium]